MESPRQAARLEQDRRSHDARATFATDVLGRITAPEYGRTGATGCARTWLQTDPNPCAAPVPPGPGVSGGAIEAAHNARMPTPELARHDETVEGEEESPRRVAGTVRLMTEDPFEIDDNEGAGIAQRLSSIAAKSPWIIPAALVGIGVAFLVLRRRR